MKGQSAPAPIRGCSQKAAGDLAADEADGPNEQEGGAGDVVDLFPRADIRWVLAQFTDHFTSVV